MPSILLIRHGQASFGSADYDTLSPAGHAQAEAIARELGRDARPVSRIVSGSLRRQRETAAPAASLLGLPVAIDPGFDEYEMDDIMSAHSETEVRTNARPGATQVTSAEFQRALEPAMRGWIAAGDAGGAGGAAETWPQFAARTRAALSDLAEGLPSGTTALAFTSAGVIAALCVSILQIPGDAVVVLNRVAVNGAITLVASGRSGLSLISFNEHRHLEHDPAATVTLR
jgi:broad specificity phosphatase PhoE